MNITTLHINPNDLLFSGAIAFGLAFILLLGFAKKTGSAANRFLVLALSAVVLWMAWALVLDIWPDTYLVDWGWLPMNLSLAIGPLIFFYVRKKTRPDYKFRSADILHLSPLLLGILLAITMTVAAVYRSPSVLLLLVSISIIVYNYCSIRLINDFHRRQRINLNGRKRDELRWLQRLMAGVNIILLLYIPYIAIEYFYFGNGLSTHIQYIWYLLLEIMITRIAAGAILSLQAGASLPVRELSQSSLPADMINKGVWLKKAIETRKLYEDPELSVNTLAGALEIPARELSRILNIAFGKNFSDFINEYRIREVAQKIKDPAYNHLTLLGIAYDSGFNSKSTFHRAFRDMTGKSPAEYKSSLKKDGPVRDLRPYSPRAAIISFHETVPKWSEKKFHRNVMFKNYLKIAWRNLVHNKVYSALNIAGLAAGMAVALLIGLWIYSQYDYNRFLPGYDQLYQVKLNFYHSGEVHTQSGSALPLVEEFKKNYPEVKYASETDWGGQHSLVVGDKKLDPWGMIVGTDFLKMFPYPMLKGNTGAAFNDPSSIILTESIAKALFGDRDPINQVIRVDNKNNVKVTAVMKDNPLNATIQFGYLLPYSYLEENYPETKKERFNWQNHSSPEYVQLRNGSDAAAFESKIKNIFAGHDATGKIEVVLQPAKNWRLLSEFKNGKATDGFIRYVRMFGVIGILVLIIACINFVNLSTARAEKRAREVGVRKSIGSSRGNLIIQFLTESLMLTFVAFAISVAIVQLVMPSFNTITYGHISVPYGNLVFWLAMLGYVFVTGLLAGSRPAFYLSSFKPVKVLKGTVQLGKRAALPRKIMVVVQFTCSIALIISTLIIYQQISYVKNRPKGYNPHNLMMINSSSDLERNYSALKQDLLKSGQVASITKAASGMTNFPASFSIQDFPGKKTGESLEMATTAVSSGYFKTIGMKFRAGHDFATDAGADTLNVIINEAAAQRFRLKNPVDQLITFDYRKNPMRIIGVVENAIVGSPFYSPGPALYVYNPGWSGAILYRLNPNVSRPAAIKKIAAIFERYNPSFPFDYRFADEALATTYTMELLVGTLASVFAGLAIFISCLGLFGLAAYVAEQRKKEIGIRKVLGATVSHVWFLISGDFILLVIISCVIASPVAFYFLHGWLQKFDYRIDIGPGAFIIAAALTIIITIITISFQAIRSALANPVKSLRSE